MERERFAATEMERFDARPMPGPKPAERVTTIMHPNLGNGLGGQRHLQEVRFDLTEPLADTISAPSEFDAVLNARGLYNTKQFVLRLSPRVYELVIALSSGDTASYDPEELFSAYSTYIHETVHWWQHVGSTSGLVLSLCYPAQCTSNMGHLLAFIRHVGAKKSIKKWAENALRSVTPDINDALIEANRAVNNTIDTEFYKILTINPLRAGECFNSPYFECVGHSYSIAYANTLYAIIGSCDFDPASLPNPDEWNEPLERLREEKHEGFYHGSPIRRPRIGLLDIFEGQARFTQLDFIHAAGGPDSYQYYRDTGYFDGKYSSAFNEFLRLTDFTWPERIDDPIISLFLLICDLSINPTQGFPLPIHSFKDLIIDIDPGARFTRMCGAAQETPSLKGAICERSYAEYVEVSAALTEPCGYSHPLAALEEVVRLIDSDPGATKLIGEWETFEFSETNQPLRVMVSHYLAFSRDKLAHPKFFCWAGGYCVGSFVSAVHNELFRRHQSVFSDRGENERVFARARTGRDQAVTHTKLNIFFGSIILYNLTCQCILEDGHFLYDYSWLTGRADNVELVEWAKLNFQRFFGVHPDSFEMVASITSD